MTSVWMLAPSCPVRAGSEEPRPPRSRARALGRPQRPGGPWPTRWPQTRGADLDAFHTELRERADAQNAPTVEGVTLSSLHAAKGLEWDAVILAGVCEGLLPISLAEGQAAIEEERRLAYVAITRARKKLFLTCAYARQIFGQTSSNPISRFIQEIPLRAAPDHRPRLGRLQRHGLGEARQPQGHRRKRHRGGRGRVFGRSSASGPSGRNDERAARVSGSYVRPGAEKKSARR